MGGALGSQFAATSPVSDVNAFSLPPQQVVNGSPYLMNASALRPPYSMQPQQTSQTFDPALVDPALQSSTDTSTALLPDQDLGGTIAAVNHAMSLPRPSVTPEVDKGFSPITAGDAASKRESEATPDVRVDGQYATNDALTVNETARTEAEVNTSAQQVNHTSKGKQSKPDHLQYRQSHNQTEVYDQKRIMRPDDECAIEDDDETIEVADEHNTIEPTPTTPVTDRKQANKTTHKANSSALHDTKSPPLLRKSTSPTVSRGNKPATPKLPHASSTIRSNKSPEVEDPSEKLARELQAQEYGLRRRTSIRS